VRLIKHIIHQEELVSQLEAIVNIGSEYPGEVFNNPTTFIGHRLDQLQLMTVFSRAVGIVIKVEGSTVYFFQSFDKLVGKVGVFGSKCQLVQLGIYS
jgi:hypothetical protein